MSDGHPSPMGDIVLAKRIAEASEAMDRADMTDTRNGAEACAEWLRAICFQMKVANELAVQNRSKR